MIEVFRYVGGDPQQTERKLRQAGWVHDLFSSTWSLPHILMTTPAILPLRVSDKQIAEGLLIYMTGDLLRLWCVNSKALAPKKAHLYTKPAPVGVVRSRCKDSFAWSEGALQESSLPHCQLCQHLAEKEQACSSPLKV